MAGHSNFDFESFKKELLKEIRNKTRQIVKDMMAELREERQSVALIAPVALVAPIAPQYRPFDLDAETSEKQLIEDDQETLLAKPITQQMLDISKKVVAPIAPATPVAPITPPTPQYRPFDLDAETLEKQPMEGDQETLLAEPITRQRLDISKEIENPNWAKDLMKTMAQMQI